MILSKDRAGNASAAASINLLFDSLAPITAIISPLNGSYTNYSLITVTGTVNDAASNVWVNGIKAILTGNNFTAEGVSLTHRGFNIITAQAVNSSGHSSVSKIIVILGRLPSIISFVPHDGVKFYEGDVIQSAVEAIDSDGNPVQYQFIVDDSIKQSWSAKTTYSWTAEESDFGLHTLKVEVKDSYGGKSSANSEIYIYAEPVAFPGQ
jgi:hypothetical protein